MGHALLRRGHSSTHYGLVCALGTGQPVCAGRGLRAGVGGRAWLWVSGPCLFHSFLSFTRGLSSPVWLCLMLSVSTALTITSNGFSGSSWGRLGLGSSGRCWEGRERQAPSCILPSLPGPLAHLLMFLQVSVMRVFSAWIEHKGDMSCPSVAVFQTASLWCRPLRCSEQTIFLSEFQVCFRELPSFERHALLPGNCLDG